MNELKKIRTSLNMNQVDAAKTLGISRRTYQKYEALEDESDNKLKYYIFRLNKGVKNMTKIEVQTMETFISYLPRIVEQLKKQNEHLERMTILLEERQDKKDAN